MSKKILLAYLLFSASLAQAEKIKVGYSPVLSTAGLILAQEQGYFSQEGLEVEMLSFDSSGAAMTPLLGRGELDVGAGNISTGLLNAVGAGLNISMVADKGTTPDSPDGYMGLMVRADLVQSGRYKSLKDLKGMKFGLTSLGGVSQQIMAEKFLTKAGLSPSDLTFVSLSYPEMNLAFSQKELDATIQLEPFISIAENSGFAKKVADASEAYPGQQSGAIFYSEKFSKKESSANSFMKAYLRGVRDYNAAFLSPRAKDRKKIVGILNKFLNVKPEILWEKMRPVGLSSDGVVNVDLLENDITWYVKRGFVKNRPDMAKLVNKKIAAKAVAELNGKK